MHPCMLSCFSHIQLFAILWTFLCPYDSPGKNPGVGCHTLLQGIFPHPPRDGTHICLPQAGSLSLRPPGRPNTCIYNCDSLAQHLSWEYALFHCCYSCQSRRRQWHPTPVLLPGKSHGWRSPEGCSPWGLEKSDTTERLHFHALEKEMATHSSVLAWRTPGTEEPDGLPSMGSNRVGHD